MHLSFLKIPAVLLLFSLLFSLLSGGEFRIVGTADLHGDLRRLAALAPRIRQVRPHILADAGDLTGGNLLAELDGGSSMISALNMLKYDFFVPGNHDFELPRKNFAAMCRKFRGTLLGGDWKWGNIAGVPFKIVTKGKFRVGVIGLTEPGISRRHLPLADGPLFEHWEKVLRSQLAALRSEKVHFTVLIWHNGIDSGNWCAEKLLARIPGIDLVIGAHSHKEFSGNRFGKIYMVQPGAYAASAVLVTVQYDDETLQVNKISSTLLKSDRRQSAADIAALNKSAVRPFYPVIYRRICRKGDLSARNFPRLGAEALRRAGKTRGALFSSSRPDRKSANYSQYRDLFRLMPYWNTLCTVTVTRDELRRILEDLHRNEQKFKRITGTAGFFWRAPGKLECPDKITLTVSSYLMVSSPVLRRMIHEKPPRWQHTGIVERDAVEKFLSSRLK